jgi:hypothetical protein
VGRIASGVEYSFPDFRPRWRTTVQMGITPVSATRSAIGPDACASLMIKLFFIGDASRDLLPLV